MILATKRLILRELAAADVGGIYDIISNPAVMYAWEQTFDENGAREWLAKNQRRYAADGYGYWAVIEKEGGHFIGMLGLLTENIDGENLLGVAYLLNQDYWHQGFATEGVQGCLDYAFKVLAAETVYAQIRPENTASRRVAQRCGLQLKGEYIRQYRGKNMPHLIYAITKAGRGKS